MHVMQELDTATYDLNIQKIIFLSSTQEIFWVCGRQLKNLSKLTSYKGLS